MPISAKTASNSVFPYKDFRSGKGALAKYEKANGKIGEVVLAAFLVEASRYTGRSLKQIEKFALRDPADLPLGNKKQSSLSDGIRMITGVKGKTRTAIDRMLFHNTGSAPAVVILETTDSAGKSQGISYVQLAPGERFEFRHNNPVVIAICVVVGVVIITLFIVVGELIEELAACALQKHTFMRDHCAGTCAPGTTCTTTGTKPCKWLSGSEATGCACV